MHQRRTTNSDGNRAGPSKKAQRKPCNGILKVGHGGKRRVSIFIAVRAWGFLRCSIEKTTMAERPILVAGRSGQLARCLRDSAASRNVPIVAVGRPELDLEDGEGIDRVMATVDASSIINAAAYTAVDAAEAQPTRAFGVNCGGAALLADVA